MMFQKKIILGAAQFGNKYGIYTKQTKMKNIKKIKKILKYSFLNKINYLDTANDYQNSEKIIGKLSKNKFKIISKIKVKKNLSIKDLEKSIIKKTLNSLSNLKISKIYILHLHNVDTFLNNKKYLSKIYNVFSNLKKGLISKIGISTYYPEKIHKIYRFFRFEAVQVPFNIFDQRLLDSSIYKLNKFNKLKFM